MEHRFLLGPAEEVGEQIRTALPEGWRVTPGTLSIGSVLYFPQDEPVIRNGEGLAPRAMLAVVLEKG